MNNESEPESAAPAVKAKHGDTVAIHYIGTLDNGRIFDSTEGREPLRFVLGNNEVFALLEQAVVGMKVGAVKNVLIPSAQAYGDRRAENIVQLRRNQLPSGLEICVGQKMQIRLPASGAEVIMLVTAVNNETVTLDGNHCLAGLDLTFAVQLESVEDF